VPVGVCALSQFTCCRQKVVTAMPLCPDGPPEHMHYRGTACKTQMTDRCLQSSAEKHQVQADMRMSMDVRHVPSCVATSDT
jgi:hypothetical protein